MYFCIMKYFLNKLKIVKPIDKTKFSHMLQHFLSFLSFSPTAHLFVIFFPFYFSHLK